MEEGNEQKKENARDEIFSKAVRAGKRTYFFDVKATRRDELYLTVTESKKMFDRDGRYHFEKHKIFLYREDFEKFVEGLNEVVQYIKENSPEDVVYSREEEHEHEIEKTEFSKVDFEDLEK
ncbi:MAG: DNA-binding protein [Bacteroidetes bacterium GWA2_30_7]|nr:MAG: DNA-binding protein [Bacteroidetes bacterium GWA2_30_7]